MGVAEKAKEVGEKAAEKAKEVGEKAAQQVKEMGEKGVAAKVQELKYKACASIVSALAAKMNELCDVPKKAAYTALSVAEAALATISDQAIGALSAATEGLEKAIVFSKKLTGYTFQSIGFELTNEIKALVDLNVKVTSTETGAVTKHEFKVNLDKAENKAMAREFFKNMFKAVSDQAQETLSELKSKVKVLTNDLILVDVDEELFDRHTKAKLMLVDMYSPASQAEKEQLLAVHGPAAQEALDRRGYFSEDEDEI